MLSRRFILSLEGHPRRHRNSFAQRLSSPLDPHTLAKSSCRRPLPLLCFLQLPTIKFHNPFILIAMQIARGWGVGPIFQFRFSSFQTISPLECAVTRFRPLTPLECALTKTCSRNSFRMRSYKKKWGGGGRLSDFQFSFFQFPVPSRDHSPSSYPRTSARIRGPFLLVGLTELEWTMQMRRSTNGAGMGE